MSDPQPPEPGSSHDMGGAEANKTGFQGIIPEQQLGQFVSQDEAAPTASGGTAPFTEQELRPDLDIADQAVKTPLESNEDPAKPGPSTTFAPKEGTAKGTDEIRQETLENLNQRDEEELETRKLTDEHPPEEVTEENKTASGSG